MSTIGNIASTLLHAVLPVNLFPNNATASSSPLTASAALTQQPDTSQLSSFAQLISTLQQLQQTNPALYQQVTQQIATNLQSAAQTAQAGGNTAAAAQLNQLATDFTNASASGQLPNLQDLARAVGGEGHRHHFSSTAESASGSSSITASNALTQFLTSVQQSSGTATSSLNAASIIQSTLTSAGIGAVNT